MNDTRLLALAILISSIFLSMAIWHSCGSRDIPQGRYAAVPGKEYIFVIDTTTGKPAGQIKIY